MATPSVDHILIDTDVLIDFLRKRQEARAFIQNAHSSGRLLFYSSITVAELHAGLRSGEEVALASLLNAMTSVPLTDGIAEIAGIYMQQFRAQGITLLIADAVIAASAKLIAAELATLNTKHFPMTDIVVNQPYVRP